jgi:hypothetical protein
MQESVAIKSRQFRDRQVYVLVAQFQFQSIQQFLSCQIKSILSCHFDEAEDRFKLPYL